MKILLSCLLLSVLLFGRSNPFEPTDTYLEKKQKLLEEDSMNKDLEREKRLENSRAEIDEMAMSEQSQMGESSDESVESKTTIGIVEKLVEDEALEAETEIVEEQIPNLKAVIESHEILPFLNLNVGIDYLEFNVDKKYKFTDQIILHKKRKFIFDFKGKVSFYTKRKKLDNPYFESVVVGNHPKKGFFRVVILVKDNIKSYKEDIEAKQSKYTITKI